MFNFLKKKHQSLYAVATGNLIPIHEVKDPVFSQKMMGEGYAVIPESSDIFSPVEGEVVTIFQTKHAIGLKMPNGLEVLLHMGVDTVALNGEPFEVLVKEGDRVFKDTKLAVVDLDALKQAEKATDMIVVITNMDALAGFELMKKGAVQAGEEVVQVTAK